MRRVSCIATTCARGGPAGKSRPAGAGPAAGSEPGSPVPNAVRRSVTSETHATTTSAAVRRDRRVWARISSRRIARVVTPWAWGSTIRATVTELSGSFKLVSSSGCSASAPSTSNAHSSAVAQSSTTLPPFAAISRSWSYGGDTDIVLLASRRGRMVSVGESADRPLLIAESVARRYGRTVALAPTTLEVRGGDLLALIGPNGAGKSTLLSILAGALAATEGRVRVGNADHRGPPKVGWVPQRPAHYSRLSARENLELFAQPDVLLLDEPTASLDPRQRRRFWEVASRVPEQGGAVVFATQNLEELERVANRVAVLLEGRLVFDGTVDEFSQAPQADIFA